jgi:hydroxymethylpyrimidine pyrophosphatase-like HAD family hydrolase
MKEIIIAFDVDGTILNNEKINPETPPHQRPPCTVNLEVILLIQLLSKHMKNTKIIVWSGGGLEHAENTVRRYGLERYVYRCYAKQSYDETTEGKVDIAFDDMHSFNLAEKNIIVRMR